MARSRVPFQIKVQAAAARAIYALPAPLRRILAGRPARIDGQQLALDAALLLRLQRINRTSMSAGSPEQGRRAAEAGRYLVGGPPIEPVDTREMSIPAATADRPATLYTPRDLPEHSGLLVYFHGGGFVIGSRTSHDNIARFLAKNAQVRVLSVEYRLAPENPFPAAADDAVAAFDYAYAKANELGADPAKIAVGGDSAGGNLAAVVAGVTTRRGGPAPAFQLLLYPTVDATSRRRSRELFSDGFFLTDADMTWFLEHYAPAGVDRGDPRISPLLADELSGQPPAYLATAGFDPLRDEGEEYAARLAAANVPVALSRQADLIHGYANFIGAGTRFREAVAEAAGALQLGIAVSLNVSRTQNKIPNTTHSTIPADLS